MKFSVRKAMTSLSRSSKRAILYVLDAAVLSAALWAAMSIRLGAFDFPRSERLDGLYFFLPMVGVSFYLFSGLYQSVLRSISVRMAVIIAGGAAFTSLFIAVWSYFDPELLVPRSVPIIYFLLVAVGCGAHRIILRFLYMQLTLEMSSSPRVVVYGAGSMGRQIGSLLYNSPEYRLAGFVDDNSKLQGTIIHGRKVYNPASLAALKEQIGFDMVLLAIQHISPEQRREIVNQAAQAGLPVSSISGVRRLISGEDTSVTLKPIRIEDLLGRQTVAPIAELIETQIAGKTILVTGGAGSIGSEICRQLAPYKPSHIIVFDSSEFGLYDFEQTTKQLLNNHDIKLTLALGSVANEEQLKRVFNNHSIDLVYHAAAYKHVPMVEQNVLAAAENNILGTLNVARQAIAAKVPRFILISTDKAVRPTNVMGATKRFAELVVQSLQPDTNFTILSMVRFGNVLGSSGSVIPLFRKQIENGGPVTLTHKEVTRYFMTVQEAAQLVLQAGFLAKGGEVFLLDMGEPVRLNDLAKLMIQLSGNVVKETALEAEGIEIKEVGLRPGEKLYEELLISENASGTEHPKIMSGSEKTMTKTKTQSALKEILKSLKANDTDAIVKLLKKHADLKQS